MRVFVLLRATLALALAVTTASATSRGLRAASDTSNLDFADLHGDVASGLSFATLSGSLSDAPGSIREIAVASGSRGPQDALVGSLAYTRPSRASFYDIIGDLSAKWAAFGDGVPVPSGAQLSVATLCDVDDLNTCVRACATTCFGNNACQWFTLAPATRDCFLFRSLKPVAGEAFAAVAPDAQRIAGYIKAGPPALLSAKAACTQTIVYNDKDTFCVTADSTFYLETSTSPSPTQCAASPLTLVRAFENNYFNKGTENALTEELANGKLMNAKAMAPVSAGGEFTVDKFLTYIHGNASLVVTTADLAVDAQTLVLTDAGSTTAWTYTFDAQGRVTSVASSLSTKNLMVAKDPTTYQMTERKEYSKPGLQTRFSYSIHALSAVNAQPTPLSFNGGEIASSLFTSPNGFWNLVPQSDKSRTAGCWKNANALIAKLLEWGFTLEFKAEPKYFKGVDTVQTEATAAAAASKELLTTADVEQYYASTASGVGDLNFQADFPCAYLYRPYNMQVTTKLTACKAGMYCAGAWAAIQKTTDKTFFTVATNGQIQTSRAFAHWAFENKDGGSKVATPTFTFLKALATASAGLCFTETGKSLQSLALSSTVSDVLLVTKDGKCVGLGATDGTPTIVDCDATATRVSFDGAAATPTCLAGTGDACPTFAFATTLAETISIKQRDDLVAGTLSFGAKGCLVVSGLKLSFSTDKTECAVIKASYVTLAVTGGDPVDPDEATNAPAAADTVVAPPRKREIDDPDPETNP